MSRVSFLTSVVTLWVAIVLSVTPTPAAPMPADPIPTPRYAPTATPPTQAGHGADVYYLRCMPCHGDQGQGLTDEFRTRVYPPEDANCWNSGCHGARPYDNGFTIPKTIPALIGAGALQRFATADGLYHFIRSAMPYNAPGSLSDTEYLQLTAFLLERNGVMPANTILNSASLATISLHGAQSPAPTAQSGADYMLLVLALPLLAVACLFLIARRRCMMRTSIQ